MAWLSGLTQQKTGSAGMSSPKDSRSSASRLKLASFPSKTRRAKQSLSPSESSTLPKNKYYRTSGRSGEPLFGNASREKTESPHMKSFAQHQTTIAERRPDPQSQPTLLLPVTSSLLANLSQHSCFSVPVMRSRIASMPSPSHTMTLASSPAVPASSSLTKKSKLHITIKKPKAMAPERMCPNMPVRPSTFDDQTNHQRSQTALCIARTPSASHRLGTQSRCGSLAALSKMERRSKEYTTSPHSAHLSSLPGQTTSLQQGTAPPLLTVSEKNNMTREETAASSTLSLFEATTQHTQLSISHRRLQRFNRRRKNISDGDAALVLSSSPPNLVPYPGHGPYPASSPPLVHTIPECMATAAPPPLPCYSPPDLLDDVPPAKEKHLIELQKKPPLLSPNVALSVADAPGAQQLLGPTSDVITETLPCEPPASLRGTTPSPPPSLPVVPSESPSVSVLPSDASEKAERASETSLPLLFTNNDATPATVSPNVQRRRSVRRGSLENVAENIQLLNLSGNTTPSSLLTRKESAASDDESTNDSVSSALSLSSDVHVTHPTEDHGASRSAAIAFNLVSEEATAACGCVRFLQGDIAATVFFDPTDRPKVLISKNARRKAYGQKLPNVKPVSLARPLRRHQLTPEQLALKRQHGVCIPTRFLSKMIVTGILLTSDRVTVGLTVVDDDEKQPCFFQ